MIHKTEVHNIKSGNMLSKKQFSLHVCCMQAGDSSRLCTVIEDKIAPPGAPFLLMAAIWKRRTKQMIALNISFVCFKGMLI